VKLTTTILCQAGLPGEFSTFVLACQGSATLVIMPIAGVLSSGWKLPCPGR